MEINDYTLQPGPTSIITGEIIYLTFKRMFASLMFFFILDCVSHCNIRHIKYNIIIII